MDGGGFLAPSTKMVIFLRLTLDLLEIHHVHLNALAL